MNEDDARRLLLVRAVEQEDRAGTLLTEEDRHQADAFARGALAEARHDADSAFLARRSEFASRRLETRHPAIEAALRHSRWPGWPGIAVPIAAFALGIAANEFGNARRLDLLAFPLLGTFAWNIAIYLSLLLHPLLATRGTANPARAARAVAWLAALGQRASDRATPATRALDRFVRDWTRASAPLAATRVARTLHLGAVLFALGLIVGIYLRALAVEYRAGWESTFLEGHTVHALLATLLGPASAVTGVSIPDAEGIAALRWSGARGGGANAGPWIHLFTATTIGLVVIPRLTLAAWSGLRARHLARAFPVPGREDFYVRRLLRAARGGPVAVRVTPYAFAPGEGIRHRLEALLVEALGDRALARFDNPVDYGAEDTWLAAATLRPDDDHHLVLFNLSATPEAENHGAFASGLHQRIDMARTGSAFGAIIDESAFRQHFAGQAGLDDRIAARRKAWNSVLSIVGIPALSIDLGTASDDDAQRVEAALVASPALEAGA